LNLIGLEESGFETLNWI